MKPIDDEPQPPPQVGSDTEYLTHDITSALERATLAWVERVMGADGVPRREAARRVYGALLRLSRGEAT